MAEPDEALRSDADLIVIITPPESHAGLVRRALENGKSVLAEKPLAMTRSEGEELAELADQRGLRLIAAPFADVSDLLGTYSKRDDRPSTLGARAVRQRGIDLGRLVSSRRGRAAGGGRRLQLEEPHRAARAGGRSSGGRAYGDQTTIRRRP